MTISLPKRILVIDDDEDILEILRIALCDEVFEVIFTNTPEAIAAIEISSPDLVLLDVQLSGLSPIEIEICNKLKQRHLLNNHMPLILVSSESNLEGLTNACDADLFISKPFDIFQLLIHVKRFLY